MKNPDELPAVKDVHIVADADEDLITVVAWLDTESDAIKLMEHIQEGVRNRFWLKPVQGPHVLGVCSLLCFAVNHFNGKQIQLRVVRAERGGWEVVIEASISMPCVI